MEANLDKDWKDPSGLVNMVSRLYKILFGTF